jgi:hypothetical protein
MRVPLPCMYCGMEATTKDHVIPRCLLERPFPLNLPTVSSCRACNQGYSMDEEYFLGVMAQTGFVPSLKQKVDHGGSVNRMLERSTGLDAHFIHSMAVADDGHVFITPDETRIRNVTRKVAFGLYCYRYAPLVIPPIHNFVALKPVHDLDTTNFTIVMAHNDRFRSRPWTHVQTSRTDKGKVQVFDYMFVRNWVWTNYGKLFCIMRFHQAVWAAVRCPNAPGGRNPKRRIGERTRWQRELPFADRER